MENDKTARAMADEQRRQKMKELQATFMEAVGLYAQTRTRSPDANDFQEQRLQQKLAELKGVLATPMDIAGWTFILSKVQSGPPEAPNGIRLEGHLSLSFNNRVVFIDREGRCATAVRRLNLPRNVEVEGRYTGKFEEFTSGDKTMITLYFELANLRVDELNLFELTPPTR